MRSIYTPQQETNSAYNPGVTYQGGQFLAQGIGQAAHGLADGLMRYSQMQEERKTLLNQLAPPPTVNSPEGVPEQPVDWTGLGRMEGPNEGTGEGDATEAMKKAAKVTQALRTIGEHAYGYSRDQLSTMSLGELSGLAKKHVEDENRREKEQAMALNLARFNQEAEHQSAMEKLQQDQLGVTRGAQAIHAMSALGNLWNQSQDNTRADSYLSLARQKEQDTLNRLATAEAEKKAALGDLQAFNRSVAQGYATQAAVPGAALPMDRARIMALAAQNNQMLNPNLDNLLKVVDEGGQSAQGMFNEDPVSGMRFYEKRNTVLPSGVNPEKAFSAHEIMGPNGQSLGLGIPNRSGVTPWKDKTKLTPAELIRSYETELKQLDNPLSWAETTPEQRADLRKQLRERIDATRKNGGDSAPAAPAQATTPKGPVVRWGLDSNGNPVKLR